MLHHSLQGGRYCRVLSFVDKDKMRLNNFTTQEMRLRRLDRIGEVIETRKFSLVYAFISTRNYEFVYDDQLKNSFWFRNCI